MAMMVMGMMVRVMRVMVMGVVMIVGMVMTVGVPVSQVGTVVAFVRSHDPSLIWPVRAFQLPTRRPVR
jgi:hypothetical protein